MVQNYPPRVSILGLSAVILLILSAPALASTGVAIKDVISEDLVVNERMSVTLIQTNLTDIRIYLPPGAGKIQVDGEVIPYKNNLMVIPVSCSTCVINITYTLPPESISWHTDDMFLQRTLDLPFPMDSLQYQAVLPRGSVIKEFQGEAPVAPAPSSIRTDGQHIIIIWKQANPEFPKNYIVHFLGEENIETTQEGYVQEFSEWHVWVLLLFSLIIGAAIGIVFRSFSIKRFKETDLPYVSLSLLSPDERIILTTIQKHNNKIGQKEAGKHLGWSKSKVSALMTGLERKRVIQREKIGRNYTVSFAKAIEKK